LKQGNHQAKPEDYLIMGWNNRSYLQAKRDW